MARLDLIFSDGETAVIEAGQDEPILAAARRQGFDLASGCEAGACQTCQGRLGSGTVTYEEGLPPALTEAELAGGAVLCCVARPTADIAVYLPYTRTSLLPNRNWTMRLSAIERIAATTVKLRGQVSGGRFTFYPGQYVDIRVPGTGEYRSYSMASAPEDGGDVEFLIRLLEGGVMSRYVAEQASIGQQLELQGPRGIFYLREGLTPAVMVAGGTGVAPILSMLRSLAHRGRSQRPVTVCFGVNRLADLICIEELRALSAQLCRFDLRLAIAQTHPEWTGVVGSATDLLHDIDAPTGSAEAYLCGPPAMVAAARAGLTASGFAAASIHNEAFAPSGQSAARATHRAA